MTFDVLLSFFLFAATLNGIAEMEMKEAMIAKMHRMMQKQLGRLLRART
jgi:hypothetical protein